MRRCVCVGLRRDRRSVVRVAQILQDVLQQSSVVVTGVVIRGVGDSADCHYPIQLSSNDVKE